MNPSRAYIGLANKYLNTPILNLYSGNTPRYQRQFTDELKPNKSTTILIFTYPIIIIQSAYFISRVIPLLCSREPLVTAINIIGRIKKRTINGCFGFIQKKKSFNDQ